MALDPKGEVVNQDLAVREDSALTRPIAPGFLDPATAAQYLVESGVMGKVPKAQIVVRIMIGAEMGVGPVTSARLIHTFEAQGRMVIELDATLMTALIKNSGRYSYKEVRNDATGVELDFFDRGERVGSASFGPEDAKRAQLAGKDNYVKYGRDMYFARAISRGFDHYCADLGCGLPIVPKDDVDYLPMGHDQRKAIFAGLHEVGVEDRDDRLRWASDVLGRDVPTFSDGGPGCPTRAEASRLLDWLDERVAGADEPTRQTSDTGDAHADDRIPAPAAAEPYEWTEPEGAGEEAPAGAGDTVGREVPTNPVPAEHVVQTLVGGSEAMSEYRDIRRQLKAERRNAAAIATTREFLIGLGDEFKGMSEEAAVAELDRRGQLDQLTAKLIRRHLS